MKSGIYKITNTINGKFYIGSSFNVHARWLKHKNDLKLGKHGNRHLQYAWNKYGENAFIFEVIQFCPVEELLLHEQKYIDELNPPYNIFRRAESALGIKRSKEFKDKMSLVRKKFYESPENRVKTSLSLRGKKMTDEQKRKMSIVQKQMASDPAYRELKRRETLELAKNEDWIKTQSENSKKQWSDQEFREKYKKIRTGKKHSEEGARKKREAIHKMILTPEWQEANRQAQVKRWAETSEEKRKAIGAKISEAQKKRWASYDSEKKKSIMKKVNPKTHSKPTKRALDAGDSAASTDISNTSAESASQESS